jgi:hypothetical protein
VKPTKISNLVTAMLFVAVAGFFLIQQLVGSGMPAPTIALNLVLIQPTLAIVLVLSALPMIRYRRGMKKYETGEGKRPVSVDSTYAIRTLALAKAMSLTASISIGWSIAIVTYQLASRVPGQVLMPIFGALGAGAMLAAGLIVENLFRIPPEKDGDAA